MIYHGTARVFIADFKDPENVKLSAASSFRTLFKPQFDSMRCAYEKRGEFHAEFREYMIFALRQIKEEAGLRRPAWKKFYHNHKEGYWQNRLCLFYGRSAQQDAPWIVFDRESILGFDNTMEKQEFYRPIHDKWDTVRRELQMSDPERWGALKTAEGEDTAVGGGFGDELDMLALTRDEHLACIELKHGSNGKIYWVPLQAAVYGEAFRSANQQRDENLVAKIRSLVEQKIELGLLPEHVRKRLPQSDAFASVEAQVAIAEPLDKRYSCWNKIETLRNLHERDGACVPVLVTSNYKIPHFEQSPLLRRL
jgi:hypothetical protein